MEKENIYHRHKLLGYHSAIMSEEAGSIALLLQITYPKHHSLNRAAEPLRLTPGNPICKYRSLLDDILHREIPGNGPINGVYYGCLNSGPNTGDTDRIDYYNKLELEIKTEKLINPSRKKPGLSIDQLQVIFTDLISLNSRLIAIELFVTRVYPKDGVSKKIIQAQRSITRLSRAVLGEIISLGSKHESSNFLTEVLQSLEQGQEARISHTLEIAS